MESMPALSQDLPQGYTVAYEQEELQFPVYVVAFVGACFAVAGATLDNIFLIALALLAWGFAYYNFPLLETGRPRIGAGQYGIFADGLGILSWHSIKQMDVVRVEIRGSMHNELLIRLQEPLDRALLADWRKRPFYRFLMRLPWKTAREGHIRIPLDIFDHPAEDIRDNFKRMMVFYRR
jgi:hypothetical protein